METGNWKEVRENIDSELEEMIWKRFEELSDGEPDCDLAMINIENITNVLIKDFPVLKDYKDILYDDVHETFCESGEIIISDELDEILDEDRNYIVGIDFTRTDLWNEEVYEDYVSNPEEWGFGEEQIEYMKETLENINKWRESNKGRDTYL